MTTKKGLMTQYPCARGRAFVCKNIGDYIQSIATRQFIDHVDEYIEQEEADKYIPSDKKNIRLVMNGWFQWRAENWPPSNYILPLLVSMHISPLRQEQLLSPRGIEFLRKNSPVGCRDLYTEELLKSHDIPAYFSGCVTLTLGKKYFQNKTSREGFYFVDPYFDIPSLYDEIDGNKILNEKNINDFIEFYSSHADIINTLAKKSFFREYSPTGFLDRDNSFYRSYYKATYFYKVYSQKFSDDILLNAEYITHWLDVDMSNDTNEDLLCIAEQLVQKYAKAKLVVTSRIHAGLPCLGLETPVVFIANQEVVSEKGNFNTPGRLGGLVDFFRCLNLKNNIFESDDTVLKEIDFFTSSTNFENKDDWKFYARKLEKQIMAFMADDFNEEKINEIRSF